MDTQDTRGNEHVDVESPRGEELMDRVGVVVAGSDESLNMTRASVYYDALDESLVPDPAPVPMRGMA